MNIDNPSAHHILQLKKLWKEAFGDDDKTINDFFDIAFSADRCLCTFDGDKAVSVLYWFDCTLDDIPVAYIYAVATDKEYRGRGLCQRLMDYTHRHLASKGYGGAVLVPVNESLFDFYGKMGYNKCSGISRGYCKVAETPIDIRSLTIVEYEELRRKYLPEYSVIQEGANTEYLSSEYNFYGGEAFVFTAKRIGYRMYSPEYLGDTTCIPHILKAFDCDECDFRVPGDDIDFAMWVPFVGDITPPKYFGLAFD